MKTRYALWVAALLIFPNVHAPAATLYVDLNSADPVPPYADWSTAATNIQDAIDTSSGGDLILVTNGVYATGGRTVNEYALTNRVVIDKAVTVQSVNGPAVTLIQGYQVPSTFDGSNAVRCVYMTNNAALIGFTLTNGATMGLGEGDAFHEQSGGGIWCESANSWVSNCVICDNSCHEYGAGVYSGSLTDCQINHNTNQNTGLYIAGGGGVAYSVLFDSTIVSNCLLLAGDSGIGSGGALSCILSNCVVAGNNSGGVYSCTLNDCTIESNTNPISGGGAIQSTLNHCLLYNNQSGGLGSEGSGGGGAYDCVLNSCIVSNNQTSGYGGGVYYDLYQTNALGQSNVVVGNIAANGVSSGAGGGAAYVNIHGTNLNLNDWTFISNSAAGYGGGLYTASSASTLNNCIFLGNSSGTSGGGCCGPGPNNNLIAVSNCIFTSNVAAGDGGGACYAALNYCSVTGNKAVSGGGVYGIVSNCVLNDNLATNYGGGLYYNFSASQQLYPIVANCAFTNNSALGNGGGAYVSSSSTIFFTFSNCTFSANSATSEGGGVWGNVSLSYCIVSGNKAEGDGGGAYDPWSTLNSLLANNSASYGGGIYNNNSVTPLPYIMIAGSTIANNTATNAGGGIYSFPISYRATNCIIYDNSAPVGMNYSGGAAFAYCCTTPPTNGVDNITNEPLFVNLAGGDFHLQSNSPCINSGNNAYVTSATDLDGNPRIVGGTVDIGAYEYQTPVSMISYAWLQQYGLPINANTDTADPDGDGMNNYQEWIAGTNPTNALSVLEMLNPAPTNNSAGLVVSWESVSNRTYFLQSSTNLAAQPAFSTIHSNIVGQTGTTSYTDTNAVSDGPFFYRVGVQQ